MAKISPIILCILLLCNCHHNSVSTSRIEAIPETDLPITVSVKYADTAYVEPVIAIKNIEAGVVTVIKNPSLQEIFTSYLGVREATGHNDGVQVEKFLHNVGLTKGFPWCAAFVKTCLIEAGVQSANKINGMALSCENKKHFILTNRKQLEEPRAGDVGTLYYTNLGRIGHTFFFDHSVNSTVYGSIEGNTNGEGSREGDGVYRKKRSINATYSISRWEDIK